MPPAEGKRKPREVARSYPIPRQQVRTSGDRAQFFADKAEYVFGIDPSGKRPSEKLKQRAGLFRDRVRGCAEATRDEGATAVLALLEDVAAGRQGVTLPTDDEGKVRCRSNDLFAFVYAPDIDRRVTDRARVREYWKAMRVQEVPGGAAAARCLVTGEPCIPTDVHPPLKGVPGGTTSGVALVSYNADAFESQGWQGNDNAPISREAAEACATALNRLLSPDPRDPSEPNRSLGRRNLKLSADTVVCYWAPGARGQDFVSCLAGLWEANPESVKEVYQSIWKGRPPHLDDPSAFYALTLTGTQGRAIIRD
jgi:CRISPR-associated protein Csd1